MEKHPHKDEIIRWANSPEGTEVWVKNSKECINVKCMSFKDAEKIVTALNNGELKIERRSHEVK